MDKKPKQRYFFISVLSLNPLTAPELLSSAMWHNDFRQGNGGTLTGTSVPSGTKRRLDGVNDRGRRSYNELCRKCQHECKQSFRAIMIDCPLRWLRQLPLYGTYRLKIFREPIPFSKLRLYNRASDKSGVDTDENK